MTGRGAPPVTGPRILTARLLDGGAPEAGGDGLPVPWWSVTKTALAAAALRLVAEGRLALDEAIPDRPYSLRQLLQHRAGVPCYGGLAAYHAAVERGDPPWSQERLLARVQAERLDFAPGSGWAYSNVGYLLVRRMVEAAAGEDIGRALTRLVFDPLGLPDVRLAAEPADLDGTAWGNADGYHPGWVYHGLLIGSPGDAVVFLHRLMAGALLPGDLLAAMTERHPLGGPLPGRPWTATGYGLGTMIGEMGRAGRAIGHSGSGPGSTCAVYHFPDLMPPRTVAAFAASEDEGVTEDEVQRLAGPP